MSGVAQLLEIVSADPEITGGIETLFGTLADLEVCNLVGVSIVASLLVNLLQSAPLEIRTQLTAELCEHMSRLVADSVRLDCQ